MLKFLKYLLTLLILLVAGFAVSIVITGGFEIHLFGNEISCHGLKNPLLALFILIMIRFFLKAGLLNSSLFLGAFIFTLFLAEIFLCVLNPPMALPSLKHITQPSGLLGYQLVPLLRDKNIRTNSHGLRDREREWEKPKGIKRILGLGDSFTFGYQVSEKDCY